MSDIQELKHTLDIIQQKLDACHEEQRNITNKMSIKRALLQESIGVMQNDLGSALKQDLTKKQVISSSHIEKFEPIIGIFDDMDTTKPTTINEKFKIIQCKGWIRDKRVWIQAKACPLSSGIHQVSLCLLPNNHSPETTHMNTVYDLIENTMVELYLTFDLFDDFMDEKVFQVACNLNNNSLMTVAYNIDWINGLDDLTWKEQMVSIFPLTNNVIQAYFPCHLCIEHHHNNPTVLQSLDLIRLNDTLLLSKDQTFILSADDADDHWNLFGLNNQIVAKIASHFSNLTLYNKNNVTKRELIKSLGDQYVTLKHSHLNKARLHTALLLSEITK